VKAIEGKQEFGGPFGIYGGFGRRCGGHRGFGGPFGRHHGKHNMKKMIFL
jgi:hypothetical protein